MEALIQLALGHSSLLQNIICWETDRGIVLGELKNGKNETKRPLAESLEIFDLIQSIVTVTSDFLNSALAKEIRAARTDYIVALKGKHGADYVKAMEFFAEDFKEKTKDHYQDSIFTAKSSFLREVFAAEEISWFTEKDNWAGLRSSILFNLETKTENKVIHETGASYELAARGENTFFLNPPDTCHSRK